MKKQFKLSFKIVPYVIFSLSTIYSVSGCIDECDTSNSTIATVQIDSAGKPFLISAEVRIDDGLTRFSSRASAFPIPLNLNAESSVVSLIRGDTAIYSFRLNYKKSPISRGPGCGMDLIIKDLNISEEEIISNSTNNRERTILLIKPTVDNTNTPNVKISF